MMSAFPKFSNRSMFPPHSMTRASGAFIDFAIFMPVVRDMAL